jgi:hypothetical protein
LNKQTNKQTDKQTNEELACTRIVKPPHEHGSSISHASEIAGLPALYAALLAAATSDGVAKLF